MRGRGKNPFGKKASHPRDASRLDSDGFSGGRFKRQRNVNPAAIGHEGQSDEAKFKRMVLTLIEKHPEEFSEEEIHSMLLAGPKVWNTWITKHDAPAYLMGTYDNQDFRGYNLNGTETTFAKFNNCKFGGELNAGINFHKATLNQCDFVDDVSDVGFEKSRLNNVKFLGRVEILTSSNTIYSETEFKGSFNNGNFDTDVFEDSIFNPDEFYQFKFNSSEFTACKFKRKFFPAQTIWTSCDFNQCDFSEGTERPQTSNIKEDFDLVPIHALKSKFKNCKFRWPQHLDWYWTKLDMKGSNEFIDCTSVIQEDPDNTVRTKQGIFGKIIGR